MAVLVKKTDFGDKLTHLNRNVTSNKNKSNELLERVKAISTKRATKDLINNFSNLNVSKYFFQEYFKIIQYLYQPENTLNILGSLVGLNCGNLKECRNEILKM